MEPIKDFYVGKTIFITGGTGFIGKVLLEKLLYSCSGLERIYIIVRQKRGKSVNTRMDDMWNLPIFTRLRKQNPEVWKKVTAFEGEMTQPNLGLKPKDLETLQREVNIVFHCAATLKLEANLKDAVEMNTTATWTTLNICREMKQLNVFIYVSTAFCYGDLAELDERVYDCSDDPHEVMRIMTWMTDEALEYLTPKLLKFHANTYTYSKRLAEIMVKNEYDNLPVVIARPSIVIPSWSDPIPGWVDNLNGPMGVMVAAGKGVLRSMYCDGESQAEIIPVDFVANALVQIAQRSSVEERAPEIPVYNLTKNDAKSITWDRVLSLAREMVREYPLDYPLWYPDGDITMNFWKHKICCILFHWLPAILIDTLLFIFRQKRFMIHVQTRISFGLELLEYFTTRHWKFHNNNYKKLQRSLTPAEKDKFTLDFNIVEDKEYIKRCILGGREYCLKEPLENLPRARVVFNIMYLLDRFVKLFFYGYIMWIIYSKFGDSYLNSFKPNLGLGSSVMSD